VPARAQHSDSFRAITARQLQALVRQPAFLHEVFILGIIGASSLVCCHVDSSGRHEASERSLDNLLGAGHSLGKLAQRQRERRMV